MLSTLRGPAWPIVVFFAGFPLWWLLGFSTIGFLLMAIPLGFQLLKRRNIAVPRGFGVWLLFLCILVIGVLVLWVPVPGLVSEPGLGRLLSWSYRLLWFLAGTVVLLYLGNTTEKQLPTRVVVQLMAWLFAITVVGGYAGRFFYQYDFPSLLEVVLPNSIASNVFLNNQIHPGLAQVQNIIGFETPRPMAPFQYANSWGANYGMLLPFFALAVRYARTRPGRIGLLLFLVAALPPVVFSLNRGLWLGLVVLMATAAVILAVRGNWTAVISLAAFGVVSYVLLMLTPLLELLETRLANPHSDEGRSRLVELTIRTTIEHSPIIGFGSPRARQANFFSLAAGATADCRQCSPPQLGTQGTLWLLVFTTGFLGAALFIYFVSRRLVPALTLRDPVATAMLFPAVFFACVLPVYDLVSSPLIILMVTLGLLWRCERQDGFRAHRSTERIST
ncbi:hypothetical protein IWX75_001762 [Arthrobacter sp. CAN_A6]|uniref:hypothetical protein n=1 Tax=Arthrobacter sp. CAN_A6 TaxID=2787721 RepID=UPI0018C9C810